MEKQRPDRHTELPDAGPDQLEGTYIRSDVPLPQRPDHGEFKVAILSSDGELLNDWNVKSRQPGVTTKLVFRHDETVPCAEIQAAIIYKEKTGHGPPRVLTDTRSLILTPRCVESIETKQAHLETAKVCSRASCSFAHTLPRSKN